MELVWPAGGKRGGNDVQQSEGCRYREQGKNLVDDPTGATYGIYSRQCGINYVQFQNPETQYESDQLGNVEASFTGLGIAQQKPESQQQDERA